MKLIDKLSPNNSINLLKNKDESVQKVQTAYALSRVVDKMLGVGFEKNLKYVESRHYADLLQTLPTQLTLEDRNVLNQGSADLVLVAFHRNFVRVVTHVAFELYWNTIGQEERKNTHVIRPYWLGDAFEFDLEPLQLSDEPIEELNKLISERLVNDIVWMVENYKSNPPQLKKFDHSRGHQIVRKKGNWRDRYIARWSGVGMRYSTYTYNLLISLATTGTIPSNIPDDFLTQSERESILEKLNLKTPVQPKKEGK
jgi:hypothetical protein